MLKLSFDYWNALAGQMIVISSLLAGFSLSLIFSLPDNVSIKTELFIYLLHETKTLCYLRSG